MDLTMSMSMPLTMISVPTPRALLLDIEGTTTSISFVRDVLFPYVRDQLESHLERSWDTDETKCDLLALEEQARQDLGAGDDVPVIDNSSPETRRKTVVANVLWQMDRDRKTTALKSLQGHIWAKGYGEGRLMGHVYCDVPSSLIAWKERGIPMYIYSSGSVESQKLLFGHSVAGNLLELFSGHFDTNVGPKVEKESYARICEMIGEKPGHVLFITDVTRESKAALEAGLNALLVLREGNHPLTVNELSTYATITSFNDISFV
jgi:enolase-phosphatase E1